MADAEQDLDGLLGEVHMTGRDGDRDGVVRAEVILLTVNAGGVAGDGQLLVCGHGEQLHPAALTWQSRLRSSSMRAPKKPRRWAARWRITSLC